MLSIRSPSWQGPQTTAQDQTAARRGGRFLLQRKTHTRHKNSVPPRNTWVVRGCVNFAMVDIFVTELQGALLERVYVTPAIADQLRHMSSFGVLAYAPRDATFAIQAGGRRHRWQLQRLGWQEQRLGRHPQWLDIEGGRHGDGQHLAGDCFMA